MAIIHSVVIRFRNFFFLDENTHTYIVARNVKSIHFGVKFFLRAMSIDEFPLNAYTFFFGSIG